MPKNSCYRWLTSALFFVGVSFGSTIGDPVIERTYIDTCDGCSFALSTPFTDTGDLVSTWSFWADTTGRSLTPLLYTFNGTNYVISGIGATVTVTALGAQTYNFNLVSGTDVVGADTYFGYRDGTPAVANQGTISISDSSSGTLMYYFGNGTTGPNVSLGQSLTATGELPRNYSVQAETQSSAPEPSGWLLLAGGLLFFAATGRRNIKIPFEPAD
jgi:hypothetical protein